MSTSPSGEEAVRVIPKLLPDIILTDINLPGLSGLEVMRFAKTVDPEVGVIVVTGYASASNAIEALRQGAFNYITKPFDLDEIHEVVERAIANRRSRRINRELVEDLRQKNEILRNHEQALSQRVRAATMQMTTLYEVGKEISVDLELVPRLRLIAAKAAELAGAHADRDLPAERGGRCVPCRRVVRLELRSSRGRRSDSWSTRRRALGADGVRARSGAAIRAPAPIRRIDAARGQGPDVSDRLLAVPMVERAARAIGVLVGARQARRFQRATTRASWPCSPLRPRSRCATPSCSSTPRASTG